MPIIAGTPVATIDDVKARLNKTTVVDDVELQSMLDAALARYADKIGRVGTFDVRLSGGRTLILPRRTQAVTFAYVDGGTLPTDVDVDYDSGLAYGSFSYGARNIVATVTVVPPADHVEAILADVAGYFAATQRGNGPSALPNAYEAAYESPSTPLTLFPRIDALAASYARVG